MKNCRHFADILGGMGRDETAPQIQMAPSWVNEKARRQIGRHMAGRWSTNSKTVVDSNIFQKATDFPDESARGCHMALEDGKLVAV